MLMKALRFRETLSAIFPTWCDMQEEINPEKRFSGEADIGQTLICLRPTSYIVTNVTTGDTDSARLINAIFKD